MGEHVYLAYGDTLELTAYPEDGEVRLYAKCEEPPIVVIHTDRPVVLTTREDRCPDPEAHRPVSLVGRLRRLIGGGP